MKATTIPSLMHLLHTHEIDAGAILRLAFRISAFEDAFYTPRFVKPKSASRLEGELTRLAVDYSWRSPLCAHPHPLYVVLKEDGTLCVVLGSTVRYLKLDIRGGLALGEVSDASDYRL